MSGKSARTVGEGELVVINCANPKEKMWGLVIALDSTGVTLRGLDLAAVEDWLLQERSGAERLIRPTVFFLPMHRVLRIDLDESGGAVQSYGQRYAEACGRDVREALES